ncbi:alanine-synthesizing transaminase [Mycolicibacterium sp. BK556]|uniref:pyridoxal phosphate-dependent aminotransferase n=1 Tax=unclassified Mycolicibacterium TaxID=2636767 RepID=UPI00161134BC|nr:MULTISPECIES: pyridoxal phosphate-dependent aminotransferase [unclassified Mycolicibacterium]MBB3602693.1 alanine-synthesizing transaminase [Mycolicibacterium sp. BK556]MBB3632445.1 alanine-synthesizing transaminase [Mycolicibacterium sp. BK607]MBB3750478.1 alanine-synthesizing transaminase [Mycolicibacterium sp. BK634]
MKFAQSSRLSNLSHETPGAITEEVARLEAGGHSVLRLDAGDPYQFGFQAPAELVREIADTLTNSAGYTSPKGLLSARRAVVQYYSSRGVADVDVENVFLGNGAAELITMAMTALLEDRDEVLVPAPDFPVWTAAVNVNGGRAVHYRCDESSDWYPDLADIAAKVTARTRAIVIINPNNPTGAVYPPEVLTGILEIAREHNLIVCSDEIYDKILYDDAVHTVTAALAPDLLCLTFNGLSKAYRCAGFRAGWLAVSGPTDHATSYLGGLTTVAGLRRCANVPAQQAIRVALDADASGCDLTLPADRLLAQRDRAWAALNAIPGVSCVKPKGALYAFPKIDLRLYPIRDDEQFVLDLLLQEKIHIIPGTGLGWPEPDHIRIVTLPQADELESAIERIGHFLATYRQ